MSAESRSEDRRFRTASWTVAVVVAVLCGMAAGACNTATGNNKLEAAKLAISMQPDLEIVAVDTERGIITVRTKSTGQVQTVRAEDIREGQPLPLQVASGTVAVQSTGEDNRAAVRAQGQGAGGASADVRSDGSFTARTDDGKGVAKFDARTGRLTANAGGASADVDTGYRGEKGSSQPRRREPAVGAGGSGEGKATATFGADGSFTARAQETEGGRDATAGGVAARGESSGEARANVESPSGTVRARGQSEEEGAVQGTIRGDGTGRVTAEDEEGSVSVDIGAGGVRIGGKSRGASSSARGLRSMAPVRCGASEVLTLERVHIQADEDAVYATAGCVVTIKNSLIESDGFAVVATAGSSVDIHNTELDGGAGAVSMHAGAQVEAGGTRFRGGLKKKGGSFTDLGGNSFQ